MNSAEGTVCPACGSRALKVIYMAAPMHLCSDGGCSTLWGLWSWLPTVFPIATEDGFWTFMAYEHSYFEALMLWLKGGPRD